MEIDDEDVVVDGTDLQKYLNAVGYNEFEISERNNIEKIGSPEHCTKRPKCSKRTNKPTQNYKKDFKLCLTLIKIIIESRLIFKEDAMLIQEFLPSNHINYPLFLTKRNSVSLLILCIICGLMNIFFSEYINVWTSVGILALWFGHIFMEIIYDFQKKRILKQTIFKTIESMKNASILIQKTAHFLQESNNLHRVYNSCKTTCASKKVNATMFLLMPELRTLLLTVMQDLINSLVHDISEVHAFFPLKDFVSNIIYLYNMDCKIDLNDTSLENINKAKYLFFLLQSEFLKQSALCLCPVLWTSKSFSQLNHLIETISQVEKIYANSYGALLEEYNVYSLFVNNNVERDKLPNDGVDINSDLKLKVSTIRQFLQNMMVHVRFMEDSIENITKCKIDDLNDTLNILAKEANVFNELISTTQIYILKANNCKKDDATRLVDNTSEIIDQEDIETNEPVKSIFEDELFFGISEEHCEDEPTKCCNEDVFDKSNNQNLMLELKVALKDKQNEWKQRESKLLKKHPQCEDSSDEEESTEKLYIEKVRKVALDLPSSEGFSFQFPSKNVANEIATVASKWNTKIESFGDNSDSDDSTSCTDS